MDCMQLGLYFCYRNENPPVFQYRKRYGLHAMYVRYQGVHIILFQYRKRYGLHAI